MNAVTSHRGPDGTGVFVDEGVTLGHNRLAIIDLSPAGAQPMTSSDKKLVIIYNGELYNFKDIKKEIGNYAWKSESDTEVILAAYQKWGSDCVKKFNGIFAFAIWDKQKRELFLARDQMGIKPLYYYHQNGKFIFSSEIKAILEHNIPRQLNHEAYSHYLTLLFTPAPFTLFENVQKFPPAHYGILKDGNLTVTRYWRLEVEPSRSPKVRPRELGQEDRPRGREMKRELKKVVEAAVKWQLVSDRPLGLYLSGGIDSSVVLASMRKVRNDIDTFSVGFELNENEQSEKFNADFALARETAKFFRTNHHEVFLPANGLIERLEKAIWHLDEPLGNATIIPQLVLAEFTKPFATVALTGDGGDELLGGYPRYQKSRWLDFTPFYNTPAARFARFMFQKDSPVSQLSRVATREFFEKSFPKQAHNITEQLMNLDLRTWLIDESLLRTDKMNMAFGVEARVPLLDREVVEFAAGIPIKQKLARGGKGILKDAFESELPPYLLTQPKRGFFSPAAKWLRRPEFVKLCRELFQNKPEFLKLLDEHITKKAYHAPILWAELSFQIWAKRYRVSI